jgi:urease accessory protein
MINDSDDDESTYIQLLLTDSNLPTGSFVASSGLESFVKHGFFQSQSLSQNPTSTINFIQDNLATYARSALPFVSDAHRIVQEFSRNNTETETTRETLSDLKALDELYEVMTLNHVAKRASKSQGVALLTLYSKGFARPAFLIPQERRLTTQETRLMGLIDQLKLIIRREETQGHLPICWGVLTGALQLSLGTACFSDKWDGIT